LGKVRDLQVEWNTARHYIWVGCGLTHKYHPSLKTLARGKHLICRSVSATEAKFCEPCHQEVWTDKQRGKAKLCGTWDVSNERLTTQGSNQVQSLKH
jgi:hypothetical protein